MVRVSVDHPEAAQYATGQGHHHGQQPTRTLHLMHHSMQFDDPPSQFAADLNLDLSREPDILTLGEMNRFRGVIQAACQDHGYMALMDSNIEEAILVKRDPNMQFKKYGSVKVLNQYGQTLQPPWYSARYISWVRVLWYDQPIYHHTQHWVAHVDDYPQFLPAHAKQSVAMGQLMKQHGEGQADAFFAGDLNWDVTYTHRFTQTTRPDLIFATFNCQDIYSELNKGRPATFHDGRTLDYVVRYLRDTNVKGNRFKVWPLGNSDHRALSTWYDLDFAVSQPVGVGGGDETDVNDTSVVTVDWHDVGGVTGGDVDWSDYMDDATYMLTRVVEDSDLLRG